MRPLEIWRWQRFQHQQARRAQLLTLATPIIATMAKHPGRTTEKSTASVVVVRRKSSKNG